MRLAALVLVTCAVTACGEWQCIVDDCLVADRFAFAVVYGEVAAAPDGAPAPDVDVLGGINPDGCEFDAPVAGFQTTTDHTGRYRLELNDLGTGFTACVTLVLEPSASSGLSPDTVTVEGVRFEEEVTDSVRVDVVLESS